MYYLYYLYYFYFFITFITFISFISFQGQNLELGGQPPELHTLGYVNSWDYLSTYMLLCKWILLYRMGASRCVRWHVGNHLEDKASG